MEAQAGAPRLHQPHGLEEKKPKAKKRTDKISNQKVKAKLTEKISQRDIHTLIKRKKIKQTKKQK